MMNRSCRALEQSPFRFLQCLNAGEILASLSDVFVFEFASVEPPAELQRDISLAADSSERRENQFFGIGVESNQSLNHVQLQWANVASVVVCLSRCRVERVRFTDVGPCGFRPIDPLISRNLAFRVNWYRVLSTGTEFEQIVGDGPATLSPVGLQACELQLSRPRADC